MAFYGKFIASEKIMERIVIRKWFDRTFIGRIGNHVFIMKHFAVH